MEEDDRGALRGGGGEVGSTVTEITGEVGEFSFSRSWEGCAGRRNSEAARFISVSSTAAAICSDIVGATVPPVFPAAASAVASSATTAPAAGATDDLADSAGAFPDDVTSFVVIACPASTTAVVVAPGVECGDDGRGGEGRAGARSFVEEEAGRSPTSPGRGVDGRGFASLKVEEGSDGGTTFFATTTDPTIVSQGAEGMGKTCSKLSSDRLPVGGRWRRFATSVALPLSTMNVCTRREWEEGGAVGSAGCFSGGFVGNLSNHVA